VAHQRRLEPQLTIVNEDSGQDSRNSNDNCNNSNEFGTESISDQGNQNNTTPHQDSPNEERTGHHMTTRSKHGIFKPKAYHATSNSSEPACFNEALQDDKWKAAMDNEYNALIKNGTWTLVPAPRNKSIIGCRWTYKVKRNSEGNIDKYKARLVAKGYTQQYGIDFSEPFSPVVKPTTIRVILTISS